MKKVTIVYENNGWSVTAYKLIVEMSKYLGIELVNPASLHAIPPGLNATSILNYENVFQAIINSQARLLILLCQYPASNYAVEYLYDLGMRKGDLVIYGGTADTLDNLLINDSNLYKRYEVAYSAVQILYQVWAGELGLDTKNRIIAKYHTDQVSTGCYYFDSIYLVGNALDYMINRGQNYTDPKKLMKAIRNTKFIGCTGAVSIDNGSNDRTFVIFLIQAIKSNKDGNPLLYNVGEMKPFSSQLLSITEPIIYADETTNKPSDMRNVNNECPFPNDKIQTFAKGRAVLFVICFVVSLITAIITFIIYKQWWNIPIEALKSKHEISLQDAIVGITIAVEFFQFSVMVPDASLISSLFYNTSNAVSLNLENIFMLRNGVFWIVVDAVYGGIFLWVIFCIVVLLRLDEKWEFIWVFRLLGSAQDYLMPILGNLCFIPFISICLDIFVCDQSIGNNFTDSFLAKDCYYFCWKGEHLYYAIFAFIALIAYEPLAVFCRPLWQELQPTLHVKSSPLFLMMKTIIQTFLIVLNKTVKRASDITHGVIFIVVMIIYILFIVKFKPYNYSRFSLWQALSLIGVLWLSLLSTIGFGIQGSGYPSTPLLLVLIFGWVLIVLIGLYVQHKKCPSMLYRPKSKDTSTLFKFAFTFGKVSKKRLEQFKKGSKTVSNS